MYRFACVSLTALAVGLTGSSAFGQQSTETYTYDALGRLVGADTDGGQNNNEIHSICYDAADNRTSYVASATGTLSSCVNTGVSSPAPTPTPTPTPTPSNSPPVAVNDSATVYCETTATISLTANDSDPDGNTPLTVTALTKTSGKAMSASIVAPGSAQLYAVTPGTRVYSYTVQDTLGATDQGTLTVTVPTSGCSL